MSNKEELPTWGYTLLGAIVGGLVVFGYCQRQEPTLSARWEAVTGTTLEEAEQKVKACQPCIGVLATKHGSVR